MPGRLRRPRSRAHEVSSRGLPAAMIAKWPQHQEPSPTRARTTEVASTSRLGNHYLNDFDANAQGSTPTRRSGSGRPTRPARFPHCEGEHSADKHPGRSSLAHSHGFSGRDGPRIGGPNGTGRDLARDASMAGLIQAQLEGRESRNHQTSRGRQAADSQGTRRRASAEAVPTRTANTIASNGQPIKPPTTEPNVLDTTSMNGRDTAGGEQLRELHRHGQERPAHKRQDQHRRVPSPRPVLQMASKRPQGKNRSMLP